MPRPRKEPDPLHGRKKLLAEQERLLAQRMSRLNEQLARGGEEKTAPAKPPGPPVWRLEEDAPIRPHRPETSAAAGRVLAAQRRRDKIVFFVMMVALLIVVLLVLALAHSHMISAVPRST